LPRDGSGELTGNEHHEIPSAARPRRHPLIMKESDIMGVLEGAAAFKKAA